MDSHFAAKLDNYDFIAITYDFRTFVHMGKFHSTNSQVWVPVSMVSVIKFTS